MRELMTREIAEGLPGLYEQDGAEDPTVYVHYFSCVNGWDWWLLEFDGTDKAFGLVEGYDDELGYFSLKEMAEAESLDGFRRRRARRALLPETAQRRQEEVTPWGCSSAAP